ncbi:hypothetical protein SADUNF_Sadunf17G0063000 [Salix dunnii]|uniref:Uncharacterized protein n=1 Tax=Salix dunnii TaxID=1413687 RepID=A0A835JA35_9ROSI|nr:hypothetical protein SADUNF_Sadunf17G0063000 [Salix dunnii]
MCPGQWLQNQFMQKGKVLVGDLPRVMGKLKAFICNKEEITRATQWLTMGFSADFIFPQGHNYLGDDPFLKQFLPIDRATKDLFNLVKDGVLLHKLINIVVPGIIDERVVNTKRVLNSPQMALIEYRAEEMESCVGVELTS